MSTWWRTCRACGGPGTDVRRCPYCGEFTPYGSQAGPYDDWRLIAGIVVLATVVVAVVLAFGVLATFVGGP